MCGITGFISNSSYSHVNAETSIRNMSSVIQHRGPDDHGVWFNKDINLVMAHRRLSIVDTTIAGHQPMVSHSQRYVLAFNGEIYNHLELRSDLEKMSGSINWRGYSDTETLSVCFDSWGIDKTLEKINGMFSISLWDQQERKFYLIRDRVGEKPLYYGIVKGDFVYGSELKSIKEFGDSKLNINRESLSLLLKYNYIPSPHTIYDSVYKLEPGTYLKVSCRDNRWLFNDDIKNITVYWSMSKSVDNGIENQFRVSESSNIITGLEELLKTTIRSEMNADVSLGAFLSGGIDSSLVTALMQSQSSKKVKTFSIGFNEKAYNEAHYAKEVASYLGTDHTELYVTSRDVMDVIPLLPSLYDEPFADCSQLPTYLVSKLARQSVTVALSGDGGDELFGGYNRYFWVNKIWSKIQYLPFIARKNISSIIKLIPPDYWNSLAAGLNKIVPMSYQVSHASDKAFKLANILSAKCIEDIYNQLITQWSSPEQTVIGATISKSLFQENTHKSIQDFESQMMFLDSISFLPDDILVKVDRAAMGVSLETRAPFLDHNIVEYALKIPLSMKINNEESKWVLREILCKYIPKKMVDRPKMGFGVPIDSWLRGPLREWSESLLDESRLKNEGYFNTSIIRKKWYEHTSGQRNWQYHLWSILMFQEWLEKQK